MDKEDWTEHNIQTQKLEALGLFAGGIAHDFNNILSIIEGYTYIAIKQLKEGTLTEGQLKKILTSTQRGAGLTRQLLAFGRQKVDVDEKVHIPDGAPFLDKPLQEERVRRVLERALERRDARTKKEEA